MLARWTWIGTKFKPSYFSFELNSNQRMLSFVSTPNYIYSFLPTLFYEFFFNNDDTLFELYLFFGPNQLEQISEILSLIIDLTIIKLSKLRVWGDLNTFLTFKISLVCLFKTTKRNENQITSTKANRATKRKQDTLNR